MFDEVFQVECYLVLVRTVCLINDPRVSGEKYSVIAYEKVQKEGLLDELEKCQSKLKKLQKQKQVKIQVIVN
jgi:hypothetical protein